MITYEQYLRDSAVPKSVIDAYLDPEERTWAQFDPELGYTLRNSLPHDGMDHCFTISTSQRNGARTSHIYADRPCRINTYGNSFTQCHQVSDAETWQEYLAAHLGEPVRNFGMGGYGFYQAYRRMVRTEQSDQQGKYVILYLWGNDHLRSVMRSRYAVIYPTWSSRGGMAFHNNFWANIEMDMKTGQFVEKESLLSTPESLYKMTDPDYMVDALRDDLMVQLNVVNRVDTKSLDMDRLNALAEILHVPPIDSTDPETTAASASQLMQEYGFSASRTILEMASKFCQEAGRELLICLFCRTALGQLLAGEARYDQCIPDYLTKNGYKYFDMSPVHLKDYKSFNLSIRDYLKRYFVGHYSPSGNHFFAYSIKDTIVDWLDPKPITYRDDGSSAVDFRGYLQLD